MRKFSFFVCLLAFALLGCSKTQPEKIDTRPLVRIGSVTNDVEFVDSLRVQGMVRTRNSAQVSARVPGTIDALLVEEGSFVKAGVPMFRVDQVNLLNAVRVAKDDLAMAKAKLAQAEATDAKAALDLVRMERLLKDGAVTRDVFEKSDVAAKSHGAALAAAKAALAKAETGLSVAEKNLADSEVRAPFDGIVTQKKKNAGDFVGAGIAVFAMDDPSVYEICISLNAVLYGRVVVGKTEVEVSDLNEKLGTPEARKLLVSYKSPSVSPVTRTFEIRTVVPKTDAFAAGMIADCEVVFARRRAQAVPATAVALRGGSDAVFKVEDGKVVRVPVKAGLSTSGLREIVSPKFTRKDTIIVEGMLLVNEGDEVRTQDVSFR